METIREYGYTSGKYVGGKLVAVWGPKDGAGGKWHGDLGWIPVGPGTGGPADRQKKAAKGGNE